ncbi:hypothetical protein FISHEDRAFT_71439 [Fistulina hepatica ATCC 64428]|nr:hypothetical protein FISHEDRAFT_71439 [Fistulina hepatica ATCC 64428]
MSACLPGLVYINPRRHRQLHYQQCIDRSLTDVQPVQPPARFATKKIVAGRSSPRADTQSSFCALLHQLYPDFDVNKLESICAARGIVVPEDGFNAPVAPPLLRQLSIPGQLKTEDHPINLSGSSGPFSPAYSDSPASTTNPSPMVSFYNEPSESGSTPHSSPQACLPFPVRMPTEHHGPLHTSYSDVSTSVTSPHDPLEEVKGQDPNSLDMSNTKALVKNFGVSETLIDTESNCAHPGRDLDAEDLAIGNSGLSSGRDRRSSQEDSVSLDTRIWMPVVVPCYPPGVEADVSNNTPSSHNGYGSRIKTEPATDYSFNPPHMRQTIWLPRDLQTVEKIAESYFSRLNIHRPVFTRRAFDAELQRLYGPLAPPGTFLRPSRPDYEPEDPDEANGRPEHPGVDPGFLVSFYLIMALGTLNELNTRTLRRNDSQDNAVALAEAHRHLFPGWPTYNDIFQRALSVKWQLRQSQSSLQAIILLHWYLYTERPGRSLWRLVGSLVRQAVELGLHYDPTIQTRNNAKTFTRAECHQRIRLWAIVLLHDRGTSVLLGRPLALSPRDTNTPHPYRRGLVSSTDGLGHSPMPSDIVSHLPENLPFSEHFEFSAPIADIQADIVTTLYSPQRNSSTMVREGLRILRRMDEFQKSMGPKYEHYFGGTDDWSPRKKKKFLESMSEDVGLTVLKIAIARILALRTLFANEGLPEEDRRRFLNAGKWNVTPSSCGAVITSHNIIILHSRMMSFPVIGFFTAPIPLHLASLILLYGVVSPPPALPEETVACDIAMALEIIPHIRWRWERKDLGGAHPQLAKLAANILKRPLSDIIPPSSSLDSIVWPQSNSAGCGVLINEPSWLGGSPKPAVPGASPPGLPGRIELASHISKDFPASVFYPFYPEQDAGTNPAAPVQEMVLSMANGCSIGGYQPNERSFLNEEYDDESLQRYAPQHTPHRWPSAANDWAASSGHSHMVSPSSSTLSSMRYRPYNMPHSKPPSKYLQPLDRRHRNSG